MKSEIHYTESNVDHIHPGAEEKRLLKALFALAKTINKPYYPDAHDWCIDGALGRFTGLWVICITMCPESGNGNDFITVESFKADPDYISSLSNVKSKLQQKKAEYKARQLTSIPTKDLKDGGGKIKVEVADNEKATKIERKS